VCARSPLNLASIPSTVVSRNHYSGPPMMPATMRENGVRSLSVRCADLLSRHGIVPLIVELGTGELIDGSAIGREGMVGRSSALDANISIRLAGHQGRSYRMGLAISRDRLPVTR